MERMKQFGNRAKTWSRSFLRRYWIGTAVMVVATGIFFWPLITNIGTYSEGGDAMFNAWTLARNHHCIMQQDCPDYSDGNIYFPNQDSMLYSETQLSTGLVSLPLHWIDPNPIFAYNVMTILSFFLAGWFMYLLAKRLSGGDELFSILAGLIFAFAPHRMSSLAHLQNLCIFILPLAVLFILKYFDRARKWLLAGLFVALLYLFFASWYQMVFGAVAIGVLLLAAVLVRLTTWKVAAQVAGVVVAAAIMTLPLALEYTRFSKEHGAGFNIGEQVYYSSSVADYFLPNNGTLMGRAFYENVQGVQVNAYNRDSVSYHGYVLYMVALAVLIIAWRLRKKGKEHQRNYRLVVVFLAIAVVGFIISLGPLLKVGGGYSYAEAEGYRLVIPLPYLAVDLLLPQLSFIRAIGRASVLVLFALCAFLAFAPVYMRASKLSINPRRIITAVICLLVIVELMPAHRFLLSPNAYSHNLRIPAMYEYIKARPEVDRLVILRADKDYPNAPIPIARAEDVLWAGYHNRQIFNGYSGYEPPTYLRDYYDFVDFGPDDPPKLERQGLSYVLLDKQLSSSNPELRERMGQILLGKVYEDERYALFRL